MDINELKEAARALCDWFKKNCCIHDHIVINADGVKIVSDTMFIPSDENSDVRHD